MNILVFFIVLLTLQLVCVIAGKKAAKLLTSQDDYFLAGRGISLFPLLMTLVATQVGGGLVLGSAEEAYRYGWNVLFYPFGAALGLLVLAAGIGKALGRFNVSTVAQLFEVVYRSTKLKKVASLLSIISLFMILIAQVIASRKFLLSLGLDQTMIFLGFCGIVILYTVIGGLRGVVAADIIQASFLISVFVGSFIYVLLSNGTSLGEIIEMGRGENFDFDQAKLMGWLLMPLLFMCIEQDMAQRCFAAKSGRTVTWATLWAAIIIMMASIIPIYYGILGNSMGIVSNGSSILLTTVMAVTTPTISAIMACAILTAVISTSVSLINAISSNVAQDFDWRWLGQNVQVSRLITASIGCLAVVGSFYSSSIVGTLIQSYELSVSCLFVPVIAALFIRQGNSSSAGYAVLLGAIGFCLFRLMPVPYVPKEIASLLLSLIGFMAGEMQARLQAITEPGAALAEVRIDRQ